MCKVEETNIPTPAGTPITRPPLDLHFKASGLLLLLFSLGLSYPL